MKKLSLILFLCLFTTNVFCEKYDGNYWDKLSKSNLIVNLKKKIIIHTILVMEK